MDHVGGVPKRKTSVNNCLLECKNTILSVLFSSEKRCQKAIFPLFLFHHITLFSFSSSSLPTLGSQVGTYLGSFALSYIIKQNIAFYAKAKAKVPSHTLSQSCSQSVSRFLFFFFFILLYLHIHPNLPDMYFLPPSLPSTSPPPLFPTFLPFSLLSLQYFLSHHAFAVRDCLPYLFPFLFGSSRRWQAFLIDISLI